ncbi:hypothetical protein D3C72_1969380 [compost metagenome]
MSSEKALHSSRPATKPSKRSVSMGLFRCFLARGEISTGMSMMKVGWISSSDTFTSKISLIKRPRVSSVGILAPSSSASLARAGTSRPEMSRPRRWLMACSMVRRGQGAFSSIMCSP